MDGGSVRWRQTAEPVLRGAASEAAASGPRVQTVERESNDQPIVDVPQRSVVCRAAVLSCLLEHVLTPVAACLEAASSWQRPAPFPAGCHEPPPTGAPSVSSA